MKYNELRVKEIGYQFLFAAARRSFLAFMNAVNIFHAVSGLQYEIIELSFFKFTI